MRLHLVAILVPAVLAAGLAAAQDTIVETAGGRVIGAEALVDALEAADIAVLGEVHDNPVHHERQAWLIARLDPGGVAFEMVPEDREKALEGLAPDAIAKTLDWDTSGWPAWRLYEPVFEAAADARIAGGGVERAELGQAMMDGAAALWGRDGDPGLGDPLPEAELAILTADMVEAHCGHLPEDMAPGMIEAQRLRDARFALAAIRARGAEGQAVLITGNGHARTDRGVPVYLSRLAPDLSVLSLGQIELEPGASPPEDVSGLPYDYVWFSATAEREDPCAAFLNRSSGG